MFTQYFILHSFSIVLRASLSTVKLVLPIITCHRNLGHFNPIQSIVMDNASQY